MKNSTKSKLLCSVFALLLSLGRTVAVPPTLINDFETTDEINQCTVSSGVTSTIVTAGTGITHGMHALQITYVGGSTASYPTATIRFSPQNCINSGALAMDVYNPGANDTTFTVRIDDPSSTGNMHCLYGTATVTAGVTLKLAFPLIQNSSLSALQTSFGFKSGMPFTLPTYKAGSMTSNGATAPDLTQVCAARIYIGSQNPSTDRTLVIDNLHLIPGPTNNLTLYSGNMDFESGEGYTAGNLANQQGWTSALGNTGTSSIVVSTVQCFSGVQSLLITDNDGGGRPIASYNLGSNRSSGTFNAALSRLNTNATAWYMYFYGTTGTNPTFTLESNGVNSITLKGGGNGATVLGTYTDAALQTLFANWNTVVIEFSEAANTAAVLLNGTTILTSSDTATNWTIGRVDLSVGYSGGSGLGIYFDSLIVPKTSTISSLALYEEVINDFETTDEQSVSSTTKGVTYSYVTSPGVTSGRKALRVDWIGNSGESWPRLTTGIPNMIGTPASADWLGRNAIGLAFDVYNPNATSVSFLFQINNQTANAAHKGSATITAGSWGTYVVPLYTLSPLGIHGIGDMDISGTSGFDFQHVTSISYFLGATAPSTTTTLYFDNLRLISGGVFAGAVDRYGQYSRAEWTGKVSTDSNFVTNLATENADLAAHPNLPDLDKYGGWIGAGSPQLATGNYFRTQQVNGKWWLVNPLGHIFFGTGMTTMNPDNASTFICGTVTGFDRSGMFAQLPPTSGDLLSPFWLTQTYGSAPFSGGGMTFNHYEANLYRKYGSTWRANWIARSLTRVKSWGFNMLGLWASWDLAPNTSVPYVMALSTTSNIKHKTLAGISGTMPDVWDPNFVVTCNNNFSSAANHRTETLLIGYFVDNELGFGKYGSGDAYQYPVVYAAMKTDARVTGNSPAKDHLIAILQSRYGTITEFNAAWGTVFTGWTDGALLNTYTLSSTLNASQRADFDAYMSDYSSQYYSVVRTVLRAYDSNHLYMGSRYYGYTSEIYTAAAQYCDVVSFNIYKSTVDSSMNFLDTLGKPCFIGEFHFGATDRGGFAPGCVIAENQADRAVKFQAYVASAMAHSGIVGCNWFQYIDEPITGRSLDGENWSIGFVSVTDQPYPEMVEAARAINATLYTGRY